MSKQLQIEEIEASKSGNYDEASRLNKAIDKLKKQNIKKALNELLETIKVNNWHCGIITLHYAFNNRCTIDSKCEQNKVRRLLKNNGFVPHFNGGILSILITI